jgi:hypothetical protein
LLANGGVLVAGGFARGGTPLSNAEIFDSITGNWTPASSMHDGRWVAAACLLSNGEVLVAGGSTNGSIIGTKRAELFDSVTESPAPHSSSLFHPDR